jgi:hypothetical protein
LQQGYEKQNLVDIQPLENPPTILGYPNWPSETWSCNGVYDHKSFNPIVWRFFN